MTEILFLTLDEVLALHASRIEKYGGSLGVRDLGGLQSALAMPAASFGGAFLHPTLAEMASAYLFHVAQAHAFVDGNKRTALATAIGFLAINDHELRADPDQLTQLVLDIASGKGSKAAAAVFFARTVKPARNR